MFFQLFGNVDFSYMVEWFDSVGGYEVVLPFLLVFTVIFAILQKVKILGTDEEGRPRKNINLVIALILGLLFIAPQNYLFGLDVVSVVNSFLPKVSLAIVVGLMVILMIGLFGGGDEWTGFAFVLAVLFSFLAIVWALIPAEYSMYWPYWLSLTPQDKAVLLTVCVFVIVIWFVTKEEKPQRDYWTLLDKLTEGFKRKKS